MGEMTQTTSPVTLPNTTVEGDDPGYVSDESGGSLGNEETHDWDSLSNNLADVLINYSTEGSVFDVSRAETGMIDVTKHLLGMVPNPFSAFAGQS